MKPKQQRIAIAETCGWTEISMRCLWGLPPGHVDCGTEDCLKHLPDYLNDLNAMHEAEKMFRAAIYCRYISELCDLAIKDNNCMYMATAAQRAEAFLRATGKWVES